MSLVTLGLGVEDWYGWNCEMGDKGGVLSENVCN